MEKCDGKCTSTAAWQTLLQLLNANYSLADIARLPETVAAHFDSLCGVPAASAGTNGNQKADLAVARSIAFGYRSRRGCRRAASGSLPAARRAAAKVGPQYGFHVSLSIARAGCSPSVTTFPRRIWTAADTILLASEARLASFLSIGKGEIDYRHWFHLGRPLTNTAGLTGLLSWGGTMFEYMMPGLFLRSYPETLLAQSCEAAVQRQIQFGRQQRMPGAFRNQPSPCSTLG